MQNFISRDAEEKLLVIAQRSAGHRLAVDCEFFSRKSIISSIQSIVFRKKSMFINRSGMHIKIKMSDDSFSPKCILISREFL